MKILAALKEGVRGQRYYALLKAFLSVKGKMMVDDFRALKQAQGGHFYVVDLGYMALKYGLNFKATCEWFAESGLMKMDYDDIAASMRAGKYTVAKLYDGARAKWGKELAYGA